MIYCNVLEFIIYISLRELRSTQFLRSPSKMSLSFFLCPQKHVLVVVEGAKGVSVVCSGNSWPTEGVEVSTDRASLSEWNERLEVNFKWMTPNGDDNLFQYTPIVSCTAVDKHGETTVEKAL